LLTLRRFPPLIAQDRAGSNKWVTLGDVPAEVPLRFGAQKQLLVDNEALCDWWALHRVLGPVRKYRNNPVLAADQPWEEQAKRSGGVIAHAALFDSDEGLFKMWYSVAQPLAPEGNVVAYAVSRDGVTWTKPLLQLLEFNGSKKNNLCLLEPFGKPVYGLFLVQDARRDSPDQRYKAIGVRPFHEDGTMYGAWLGIAYSADGTTWHQAEGGLREGSGGSRPGCVWDEGLQRYVLFHRQLSEVAYPARRKRYIVRQESADLRNWSAGQTAVNPMEGSWPEVESMNVLRYEGMYFGLAYFLDSDIRGTIEIHLATSHDGYRWSFPCAGQPLIPRGPRGDFDDMLILSGHPVIKGDNILFFYSGARWPHSYPREPIVADGSSVSFLPGGKDRIQFRPAKVGLATLPLDRFAGLRADEPVGAFLTRPFFIEGEELYVNADVDRELRVEVVNPVVQLADSGPKESVPGRHWTGHYIQVREEVFPGFAAGDCEAITGDSLRHRVRWKGGGIGKFKGQAVRLRFLYRLGTVYAFQVK
jgi:hypothetical protein